MLRAGIDPVLRATTGPCLIYSPYEGGLLGTGISLLPICGRVVGHRCSSGAASNDRAYGQALYLGTGECCAPVWIRCREQRPGPHTIFTPHYRGNRPMLVSFQALRVPILVFRWPGIRKAWTGSKHRTTFIIINIIYSYL